RHGKWKVEGRPIELVKGKVKKWAGGGARFDETDIAGHSDNDKSLVRNIRHDLLGECTLIWPVAIGERLIDHHHRLRSFRVLCCNVTARHDRDLHRAQIIRTNYRLWHLHRFLWPPDVAL